MNKYEHFNYVFYFASTYLIPRPDGLVSIEMFVPNKEFLYFFSLVIYRSQMRICKKIVKFKHWAFLFFWISTGDVHAFSVGNEDFGSMHEIVYGSLGVVEHRIRPVHPSLPVRDLNPLTLVPPPRTTVGAWGCKRNTYSVAQVAKHRSKKTSLKRWGWGGLVKNAINSQTLLSPLVILGANIQTRPWEKA